MGLFDRFKKKESIESIDAKVTDLLALKEKHNQDIRDAAAEQLNQPKTFVHSTSTEPTIFEYANTDAVSLRKKKRLASDPMSYANAGVDVKETDKFVRDIGDTVKSTQNEKVLNGLGDFASMYDLSDIKAYDKPIMLTSTDGIGTKLDLLLKHKLYKNIGHDLVSMVVNDIAVHGGQPLVFLDYIAASKFDAKVNKEILKGIAEACSEIGCALVGGETAVMPDFYFSDKMDVAGFAVGIAEKSKLLPSTGVRGTDYILGLKSNGVHANGFSLINKLIRERDLKVHPDMLTPTRNYVNICNKLRAHNYVKAFIHITGGGFDNIKRILPAGNEYQLDKWELPEVFQSIQTSSGLNKSEMLKTFNCGYGMLMIIDGMHLDSIGQLLGDSDPIAVIGRIV